MFALSGNRTIQKEDVYETEDFPDPEEIESEEQFENAAIEKIHVDIDGAMKLFENRLLNSDAVDFSDALANNRKKRGYRSGHYILEVIGSENLEQETIEEKLRRIRRELEELMDSLDKDTVMSFNVISAKDAVGKAVDNIKDAARSVAGKAKDAGSAAKGKAEDIADNAKDAGSTAKGKAEDVAHSIADKVDELNAGKKE